jgi:hypothetical protein
LFSLGEERLGGLGSLLSASRDPGLISVKGAISFAQLKQAYLDGKLGELCARSPVSWINWHNAKAGSRVHSLTRIGPEVTIPNQSGAVVAADFTIEEAAMISMTRLVTAAAAVLALATLCPAQENVKPAYLGKGAEFKGKKIEMKDKGELAYVLSFTAGKEFEATTDGTKNTDVHLYVYDAAGKEVGKDDSPGPKCSVKVTPAKDGKYKFVIKNAGGDNTVTFEVKVAE